MKTVKKFVCVLVMCMFAFSFVPVINAGSEGYINTKNVYVAVKEQKPAKPAKLKAKAGVKKVKISFKKSKNAKKYEIYRSTMKSSKYKKIKTIKSNKYTDKKVKTGKKYYYKVRAVNSSGKSPFTKPVRSGKVKKPSGSHNVGSVVYITRTGKKYHAKSSCVRHPIKTTLSKAKNMGYTPCKKCCR